MLYEEENTLNTDCKHNFSCLRFLIDCIDINFQAQSKRRGCRQLSYFDVLEKLGIHGITGHRLI